MIAFAARLRASATKRSSSLASTKERSSAQCRLAQAGFRLGRLVAGEPRCATLTDYVHPLCMSAATTFNATAKLRYNHGPQNERFLSLRQGSDKREDVQQEASSSQPSNTVWYLFLLVSICAFLFLLTQTRGKITFLSHALPLLFHFPQSPTT